MEGSLTWLSVLCALLLPVARSSGKVSSLKLWRTMLTGSCLIPIRRTEQLLKPIEIRWQLGREPESLAGALQDQRDFILRIFHRITDFRRSWYWLLFCFVVVYHTCVCSTELLTELDPAY